MKLPGTLGDMFGKPAEKKELFLSLYLDRDGVAASVWEIGAEKLPKVLATASSEVEEDSWEDRTEAADRAIASLEDAAGTTDFHNVTLGLPLLYLTEDGNIKKDVGGHIKKLVEVLELKAMGFVPVYQALVYKLKKDEGVPPSVILLGVATDTLTLAVYKVGNLVGVRHGNRDGDVALQLEELLKSFTDIEVLPSRILLYGIKKEDVNSVKEELLRYQWTTRANFLHFPKIDVVSHEDVVRAVSFAGASELGVAMGEEDGEEQRGESKEQRVEQEVAMPVEEESNVVTVEPEELGFRKQDVLEEPLEEQRVESREQSEAQEKKGIALALKIPKIAIPKFPAFKIPRIAIPLQGGIGASAGIILIAAGVFGFIYWKMPAAIITIYENPQTLTEAADIVIDPTATVADTEEKILPGKKQEKSVSGEKTIPITGKKEVGDPAKGAVTISNKTFTARTFTKGSVLIANGLRFTLESEVAVASASENLAKTIRTYGTATGSVTAEIIGAKGNLPAGTEFVLKDIAKDIAVARNDQALAGGTSREVTVVSRADMDALVKALTEELVIKAKTDLSQGVAGSDVLIDETVQTEVTAKQFTQELDQEATQLQGSITLTVSGVSYSRDDAVQLFSAGLASKLPQGYSLVPNRTEVMLSSVKVKKDGTVTANAAVSADAAPTLVIEDIQKALAGKTISHAGEYLRGLPGIGSVEFSFRWRLFQNRMPINSKNISVTVAVEE